jgi:hypothetical protein
MKSKFSQLRSGFILMLFAGLILLVAASCQTEKNTSRVIRKKCDCPKWVEASEPQKVDMHG